MQSENKLECRESLSSMGAYLDGELDRAAAAAMASHLAGCPACAAQYAQMKAMRDAVKAHATRHVAPEYLRHRIKAALPRDNAVDKPRSKLPWSWINFGVATVCSCAFAVTLALYMTVPSDEERSEQEVVSSHARSLMVEHLSDVISTDQHTVKPWFSGKLDFAPTVYDFAQQGFPLVGGRLDYLNQRPVAALAYRHRLHVINLFSWPDAGHQDTARKASTKQGYRLLHWTQAGMCYWLISDMNGQDLSELQGLLSAQIDKDARK